MPDHRPAEGVGAADVRCQAGGAGRFDARAQQRSVHAPAGRSRLTRQHRDEPERRVAGGRGLEESFIEVMPGNRGRGDPGRS